MRLAVSFCVCTCHLVAGTIKLKLTVAIGSQGPYFFLWVLWCPAIPLASAGGRAVAELYGWGGCYCRIGHLEDTALEAKLCILYDHVCFGCYFVGVGIFVQEL